MDYLIKGAHLLDPANKIDGMFDILISEGRIADVGDGINAGESEIVDAKGFIVSPGLVDMHTHLREPGREDEETIATGTRSAVRGGFTAVCAMPNTEPAIDNAAAVKAIKNVIKKNALCRVMITGSVTQGRTGKCPAAIKAMADEGISAVSDDGSSVENTDVMHEAMKECKKYGMLVIDHCEDAKISAGGVMNKGFMATKMGLKGISKEAEYSMVQRDIALAHKAGCRIHIAHVSCKESVEIIRKAKKAGIAVTAETAPHYFSLTEECCVTYDTNTKMNPPLRTKEDVEAIKGALADGTIDSIATDHAPHTDAEKDVEFDCAPFGIIGLETALSVSFMELVETKVLSWSDLISKMSAGPARILGLKHSGLKKGSVADLVIIDPAKEYIYSKETVESKSRNSPFLNWRLKTKVSHVFVDGKPVMWNGKIG